LTGGPLFWQAIKAMHSVREVNLFQREPLDTPVQVGIAIGDLVLASNGATVLGIGRVTGEYIDDRSSDCPHRRAVEWLSLEPWQQADQQLDIEGKLTTVYKMKRDKNLLEAEKRIYRA
jgi:predicted Mrr-cat superfamily restriction endonuclease